MQITRKTTAIGATALVAALLLGGAPTTGASAAAHEHGEVDSIVAPIPAPPAPPAPTPVDSTVTVATSPSPVAPTPTPPVADLPAPTAPPTTTPVTAAPVTTSTRAPIPVAPPEATAVVTECIVTGTITSTDGSTGAPYTGPFGYEGSCATADALAAQTGGTVSTVEVVTQTGQ